MMFGGRCAARPTTVGAIRRNARTAAESRLITVWPTAVLDRSVTAVAKRIGGLVEEGGGNFGSSIGRGYLMTSGLLAWPESGGLQRRSSAAARSRRSNAGSPGSDLPHHGPEPGHLHAGERQREGVNPLIAGGAIGIAHPSARSAATSGLAPSGRPRLELRGPRRGGIVLCGQKQPCVRLNSVRREPRRTLTRRRKRPIWGLGIETSLPTPPRGIARARGAFRAKTDAGVPFWIGRARVATRTRRRGSRSRLRNGPDGNRLRTRRLATRAGASGGAAPNRAPHRPCGFFHCNAGISAMCIGANEGTDRWSRVIQYAET